MGMLSKNEASMTSDFESVVRVMRDARNSSPINVKHWLSNELALRSLFNYSYSRFRMLAHVDIPPSISSDFLRMVQRIQSSARKGSFARVIFLNTDHLSVTIKNDCEVVFAKAECIEKFMPFAVSDDDMVLDDGRLWCYSPIDAKIKASRFDIFWKKLACAL